MPDEDCQKITCCPPESYGYNIPSALPDPVPIADFDLSITVDPVASGTYTGDGTYQNGTFAEILAIPATGYRFVSWSGDFVGADNPAQVFMDSDKAIVANFELITVSLSITINPVGSGITTGQGLYTYGATANLTAIPNANSTFVSWSGDKVTTDNPTTLLMDGDKNVVANFDIASYELLLSADPPEGGIVSGGGNYLSGATAVISAIPSEGYQFDGWTGDLTSSDNPAEVSMTGNKSVVGNFSLLDWSLVVTASPAEGGTTFGSGSYDNGTNAPVLVTPNAGYDFAGWSGDLSGSSNPTVILMDGDKVVIAVMIYYNSEDPFA